MTHGGLEPPSRGRKPRILAARRMGRTEPSTGIEPALTSLRERHPTSGVSMADGAPRTSSWLDLLRAAARAGFEPAHVRLTAGCLRHLATVQSYRRSRPPDSRAAVIDAPAGEKAPRAFTRSGFLSCRVFKEQRRAWRRRGSGSRIRTCVGGFRARCPAAGRSRKIGGFPGNRTLPCRLRAGCSALELETPARASVGPEGFAPPSHRLKVECLAVGPRTRPRSPFARDG